jgi:hypothetical protein
MIHVVVMKRLIGLPLLIHIELLWGSRSRSFKNRGDGVGAFVYRLDSPGGNCMSHPLYVKILHPAHSVFTCLVRFQINNYHFHKQH